MTSSEPEQPERSSNSAKRKAIPLPPTTTSSKKSILETPIENKVPIPTATTGLSTSPFISVRQFSTSDSLTATAPLPYFTYTFQPLPPNPFTPSFPSPSYGNSVPPNTPQALDPAILAFVPSNWADLAEGPDRWEDGDGDRPAKCWDIPFCSGCGMSTIVEGYCSVCMGALKEWVDALPERRRD